MVDQAGEQRPACVGGLHAADLRRADLKPVPAPSDEP
jgi:hypothetical protein